MDNKKFIIYFSLQTPSSPTPWWNGRSLFYLFKARERIKENVWRKKHHKCPQSKFNNTFLLFTALTFYLILSTEIIINNIQSNLIVNHLNKFFSKQHRTGWWKIVDRRFALLFFFRIHYISVIWSQCLV